MPNIFDYLHWRCDVPFSASPFNDVDNLILSELVYTDFGGVVPDDGSAVSLTEARDRFFGLHDRAEIEARTAYSYTARAPFLMDAMLEGARFRDLRLCAYETVTDKEDSTQFAAVTFLLPDGTAYLAFRGTDGTVVGWKEDLILSYRSGTSGQLRAADYLARVATLTDLPLRVGGHSKGGNCAVYAAAFAAPAIQDRIEKIWTNDGPGFREEVRSREGYQRIQPKCVSIVPDTSVIGLLLDCDCLCRVIKSTADGLIQHDGFTWECGPTDFLLAEQSRKGAYLEKAVDHWVAFGLLLMVGGKMILDAIRNREEPENRKRPVVDVGTMFLLGVATSIDAFAVGIGMGLEHTMGDVLWTVAMIGGVTFAVSLLGVHLGRHNIPVPERTATILAGVVLIGLGTRILLEHLGAGMSPMG